MNENEDVGLNDCFTIPRERGVSAQREVSVRGGLPREMGLCPGGLYPGGGREDGDPPYEQNDTCF